MAEQSGFFNAHLIDGEYDRVYLAEHFAKYFASFIGNGIFGGKSNELMVRETEVPSMGVRVLSGQAWIDGYWYENDNEHPLTIDIADGVLHRIDSVVVRWNHSERIIRMAIKKGVSATNPVAPIVQRDDDYYELKLADIYVKAGATRITQANITDKRYNTDVCGLVIGVVQQLDPDEFGIQLDHYITEFMAEHDAWSLATKTAWNDWFSATKTAWSNWFSAADTAKKQFFATLESQINTVNNKITELGNVITAGNQEVNRLKAIAAESTDYPGCYYRTYNGSVEWINPPNLPGVEFKLFERWNNKPVFQKTFYTASLPNKSYLGIEVNSAFDKVISIDGFALDTDNNMYYPFPIILDGFVPSAVIKFIEGDGGAGGNMVIATDDDLTSFQSYITVKYTKA